MHQTAHRLYLKDIDYESGVIAVASAYPNPWDIGIAIPAHLRKDRYCAGFKHALRGGQLDDVEYFRCSFRLGFRAAKIILREIRRHKGILAYSSRYKLKLKALF